MSGTIDGVGTDINGFIECHAIDWEGYEGVRVWVAALNLALLNLSRDYDAFGCLFGVQNYAGFRPVAGGRGLPADISERAARLCSDNYGHDTTWITWAEVKAINWDEPAERPDARVHRYRRTPDGLVLAGKSAMERRFMDAVGYEGREQWSEGQEWTDGDYVYRYERMLRREAVHPRAWGPLWQIMEVLADANGDDGVRAVVWFDS